MQALLLEQGQDHGVYMIRPVSPCLPASRAVPDAAPTPP